MKLSFTTLGCPDWTVDEIPAKAKAAGLDAVELRTHDDGQHLSPSTPPDQAAALAQKFRDAGVPVISLMAYTQCARLKTDEIAQHRALAEKVIALAGAMKVPFIRTFGGSVPADVGHEKAAAQAAENLKPWLELAAKHDVRIGLEPHDAWTRTEDALRIFEKVDNPRFGCVFDLLNTFNANAGDWLSAYKAYKRHILYCHVKDDYPGPDGKNVLTMIGAGALPLADMLARFKADKFDGCFSLEWEKKWHPEIEAPERALPQYVWKMKHTWAQA
jgi:sugar phosphate isomerase/epimerase